MRTAEDRSTGTDRGQHVFHAYVDGGHLVLNEPTSLPDGSKMDLQRVQRWTSNERAIFFASVVFGGLGMLGTVVFASQHDGLSYSVATCGLAVGGACFFLGCLLGFLFGIPRAGEAPSLQGTELQSQKGAVRSSPDEPESNVPPYRPNTNLEQVSDWLTKILIGVGLTQLAHVPRAASALAVALGPALGDGPQGERFGVAIVLYFLVLGFIVSYLWTRLKLGAALAEADVAALTVAHNRNAAVISELGDRVKEIATHVGLPGEAPRH